MTTTALTQLDLAYTEKTLPLVNFIVIDGKYNFHPYLG